MGPLVLVLPSLSYYDGGVYIVAFPSVFVQVQVVFSTSIRVFGDVGEAKKKKNRVFFLGVIYDGMVLLVHVTHK